MEIEVPGAFWRYDGETLTRNGNTVPLPNSPGLFAEDQLVATARILDGAAAYVTEDAIVHGLDLAESLSKPAPGRVGATKDCAALVPPDPLH